MAKIRIGTAESASGRITRGELVLGEYPDGAPITSAVRIAQGTRPGPTLWVQACVHGPEVGGLVGMTEFLRQLNIAELDGTVICLAIVNPLGFRANLRLTPQDGMNLNRAFPGKAAGSVSERIAYTVFRHAIEFADAMLDLHSGGDHLVCCHHAIVGDEATPAGAGSQRLAQATGAPHLWSVPAGFFPGAAIAAFLAEGRPGVLVESGGGARVTPEDIRNYTAAMLGACHALAMLPGEPPDNSQRIGRHAAILTAGRGGIFIPGAEPGATLRKAQPIGQLVDAYGDITERFECPLDQAWLAAIRRPYMPVYSGDDIAEIVAARAPP